MSATPSSATPSSATAALDLDPETTLVVVPARLAATRLPGKPLADIHGAPMIVHVWRRAREAGIGRVIVAAGDAEIAEAVTAAGGEAVLTDPDHPSGSDRVWEAVGKVDPQGRYRTIVNVQGDLPTLEGAAIRAALAPLRQASVDIATLVCAISDPADRERPSVVKAAIGWADDHHTGTDSREDGAVGRALYFSRAPIPSGDGPLYHHIGLYAYRRSALERFVALPPSPLEQREKLEQLRALEAGMIIGVAEVRTVPLGVDTAEDLEHARAMLRA